MTEIAPVIRMAPANHQRMSRHQASLKTVLSEIAKPDDRSTLFWWMVEHHDDVLAAANGRRMQWRRLCGLFAELGLTDRTGKPATEKLARLTWFRARREVVRVRALAGVPPSRPGAAFPSRMQKDWKPAEYREASPGPPPAASSQNVPLGLRPPPPKGPAMSIMEKLTGQPDLIRKSSSEDREREIDERIAAANAWLRSRSG